jgi:hypothetical protein
MQWGLFFILRYRSYIATHISSDTRGAPTRGRGFLPLYDTVSSRESARLYRLTGLLAELLTEL